MKFLAKETKMPVAGIQVLTPLDAPVAQVGRVSWHPSDAEEIPTPPSTPMEERVLKWMMG